MTPDLTDLLDRGRDGPVVVLTGAGISAESGIPTFRGPEGYWTVGSTVYRPEELATMESFQRLPREVWRWYLYRWSVCRQATPNAGHAALARLESGLGRRFTLITQNVDGLHLRAGNTPARTFEIHGNLDYLRAANGSPPGRWPIPELPTFEQDTPLTDDIWVRLVTPDGQRARPHVLWFDEWYDEFHFRAESAIAVARGCDLLLIVGTSGATSLPLQCAAAAIGAGSAVIDINPEANPFAEDAENYTHGYALRAGAGAALVPIVDYLLAAGEPEMVPTG